MLPGLKLNPLLMIYNIISKIVIILIVKDKKKRDIVLANVARRDLPKRPSSVCGSKRAAEPNKHQQHVGHAC